MQIVRQMENRYMDTCDNEEILKAIHGLRKDNPLRQQAELILLDTGHFALEEEGDFIAERMKAFLGLNAGNDHRS